MLMNDQLITQRLTQFTPKYQAFITGTFVDETTSVLAKESNLTEEQHEMFRNAITLYLLCFLDVSQAVSFLASEADLPKEVASPLIGAVINTLPETIIEGQTALYEMFSLNTDSDLIISTTATTPQAQAVTSPVSPVRTMANDMQQAKGETTYSSSQENILRQPMTPDDPEAARWQSTE